VSFFQTVVLMPQSITSDFNLPEWHYYGKSSGENRFHYKYTENPHYQNNETKINNRLRRVSAR
ncbi:MAG: hypothetical protein ACE5GV_17750, partial [Candidatus Scalindua sp.]